MRGTLIEIHTADLHFGAMDPRIQYEILMKEMINRIKSLRFDAFYINGDIFHHKYMSNSDVVMYASMFIDQVVQLCRKNNATLVILHGTASHDANQLKLFYHYIGTVDIRIVEHIGFEIIKGKRVLCIQEEYNMGYDYYADKLFYSGYYDGVVMHGTIKNAIFGCNQVDLNSIKAPVFDLRCFGNCRGPIICGHVHIAKCYENHIYHYTLRNSHNTLYPFHTVQVSIIHEFPLYLRTTLFLQYVYQVQVFLYNGKTVSTDLHRDYLYHVTILKLLLSVYRA